MLFEKQYDEGYRACVAGVPFKGNPYEAETAAHAAWGNGWWLAFTDD